MRRAPEAIDPGQRSKFAKFFTEDAMPTKGWPFAEGIVAEVVKWVGPHYSTLTVTLEDGSYMLYKNDSFNLKYKLVQAVFTPEKETESP